MNSFESRYLQSTLVKGKAAKESDIGDFISRLQESLRIMFVVMPGCHPGFLFHVFPVTVPRFYNSLLPFDPNSVVTGNLVFIFGTLKKATPLFFFLRI